MKKVSILAAVAMATGLASCTAQAPKATLKTDVDSLSYAIGISQTQGLKDYLSQRMDRWHGEGTSNSQPLLNSKHSINNLNSEYYIEDGSFFRIRNVQLAYSFDKALLAKIRLQALKVYVNIQNLKTWKHNTGYTPEIGGSAIAFGVDNGTYPVPAVYTFGINLTF